MVIMSAFQAENRSSILLTRSLMKFIFLVQGEGRGHMSQALCLKEKLEKRGHTISNVLIGGKNLDSLPSFFTEKLDCPIDILTSPFFQLDKKEQSVLFAKSIIFSIYNFPAYIKSLLKIRKIIKRENPDALVSFYEPLAGFYLRLFNDKRAAFFVGHQYFMDHPAVEQLFEKKLEKLFFKFYNFISSTKNGSKFCLSFTQEKDIISKNIFVCPPLIKSEIMLDDGRSDVLDSDVIDSYILVYLLNSGYDEQITNWSNNNPSTKIVAFKNSPQKEVDKISDSLTFHNINGPKFNSKLKECEAYVSTAGFDSIAEASYLGKKIMMVPTENHFEQKYNALDAQRAKIALKASSFNISLLINSPEENFSGRNIYKKWCDDFQNKIVEIIEKKSR